MARKGALQDSVAGSLRHGMSSSMSLSKLELAIKIRYLPCRYESRNLSPFSPSSHFPLAICASVFLAHKWRLQHFLRPALRRPLLNPSVGSATPLSKSVRHSRVAPSHLVGWSAREPRMLLVMAIKPLTLRCHTKVLKKDKVKVNLGGPEECMPVVYNSFSEGKREFETAYSASHYPWLANPYECCEDVVSGGEICSEVLASRRFYEKDGLQASLMGKIDQTRMCKVVEDVRSTRPLVCLDSLHAFAAGVLVASMMRQGMSAVYNFLSEGKTELEAAYSASSYPLIDIPYECHEDVVLDARRFYEKEGLQDCPMGKLDQTRMCKVGEHVLSTRSVGCPGPLHPFAAGVYAVSMMGQKSGKIEHLLGKCADYSSLAQLALAAVDKGASINRHLISNHRSDSGHEAIEGTDGSPTPPMDGKVDLEDKCHLFSVGFTTKRQEMKMNEDGVEKRCEIIEANTATRFSLSGNPTLPLALFAVVLSFTAGAFCSLWFGADRNRTEKGL